MPSSKCTPGKGTISPSSTQEIPPPLCAHSQARAALLSRSAGYDSVPLHTSKPWSLSFTHRLQKTCATQFPWLPSLWSEMFSSCVNPTLHSVNPSFPLSLSSPREKGSHPSVARQLFSPTIHFQILTLAALSPSNLEMLLPILRLISWVFHAI